MEATAGIASSPAPHAVLSLFLPTGFHLEIPALT